MPPWAPFAASLYLLLGAASLGAVWLTQGRLDGTHPAPWIGTPNHALSLVLGLALAALVVASTRALVKTSAAVRDLHGELRTFAVPLSGPAILLLAAFSALGEELFFRALLQPYIGLLGQAVIFGYLHQLRGSRWLWGTWAAVVGLLLGVVYEASGSLVGPMAAHLIVNAMNLSYLKQHDLQRDSRPLGGLLGTLPRPADSVASGDRG